jgi:cyclic pyranopterin phosphate synthase
MPEDGIKQLPHQEILTFDEIVDFAKKAVEQGIDKIRITGGEPLVRKGIVELIKMLNSIPGVKELVMTSNGILLSKYAKDLAEAGLQRVNISLDTLNPEKFKKVTRGGDINAVFEGIVAAKEAGLNPVKLNCVISKSSKEPDAQEVAQFAKENGLQIRFIHQMDLKTGDFKVVEGGDGGDCANCNRLRLTANGQLKPCLFSDLGYDVRKLGTDKALELSLKNKPQTGKHNFSGDFYNIGG